MVDKQTKHNRQGMAHSKTIVLSGNNIHRALQQIPKNRTGLGGHQFSKDSQKNQSIEGSLNDVFP